MSVKCEVGGQAYTPKTIEIINEHSDYGLMGIKITCIVDMKHKGELMNLPDVRVIYENENPQITAFQERLKAETHEIELLTSEVRRLETQRNNLKAENTKLKNAIISKYLNINLEG